MIRPARPSDELPPRAVGGRDAAPPEWQDWAEEPGHDLVADDDGTVAGAIHVSIVGRTEAWMENLRVMPEFQGRGIAGELVRGAEHRAVHYGAAKVRTAIPAHEYAALAVAQRAGYHRVLESVVLQAPVTAELRHVPYDAPVESPDASGAAAVAAFAGGTQTVQSWEQLVPLGWRFRRIVPELVRGLINDTRVLVSLRADALRPAARRGMWQAGELQGVAVFAEREGAVVISLLDGTAPAMHALYGTVTEQSGRRGGVQATVFAPSSDSVRALRAEQWNPHPWCPDGLVVVEKSVAS